MGSDTIISELERRHLVEELIAALTEINESDEISQGVVDGLESSLLILGVKKIAEGEYEDTRR